MTVIYSKLEWLLCLVYLVDSLGQSHQDEWMATFFSTMSVDGLFVKYLKVI